MDEEVYMEINPFIVKIMAEIDSSILDFVRSDGTIIVKLERALYGHMLSANRWYKEIKQHLLDVGFQQNAYDNCVFFKQTDQGLAVLLLYVDDMYLACPGGES
jgi:hypothetical protein